MSNLAPAIALWAVSSLASAASYNCNFYYDSPSTDLMRHSLVVDDHTPQTLIFEDSLWYTAKKTRMGDGTDGLAVSIRGEGSDAAAVIPWGSPFVAIIYDSYASPSDLYEISCRAN